MQDLDEVDKDTTFKVSVLYGHVDLRSFFRFEEGKMIGMGSKTEYDKEGNFVSYSESETGITFTYG